MGIVHIVTDRHLLGADGRSDEVAPRQDEHVDVEAVGTARVPVLAASHGVFGAERCLQELLSSGRKVPKLPRLPRRQSELTLGSRQRRVRPRWDPRRHSAAGARSMLDRNCLVRAWHELVAIQLIDGAPSGVDPRFRDTERPDAKENSAWPILTGVRIVRCEPLDHIACLLCQSRPDLRRQGFPAVIT